MNSYLFPVFASSYTFESLVSGSQVKIDREETIAFADWVIVAVKFDL
jgi:hypothetical protein